MANVTLKPINQKLVRFTIKGISPMIQHSWSEKAGRQMRDKKAGKKTKNREPTNPEKEFQDACYLNDNDEHSIPLMAFKKALISAAHKDIGIEKTLIRKSFFLRSDDSNLMAKMECSDPIMREDHVRVGMGSADLRYRPEFKEWSVEITAQVDFELLKENDIVNLINRAGFGVGIGEWRPEKSGEYGRFELDSSKPFEVLN